MSDAYNVRSNGQRYYVYRMDGNVQVAEFLGAGAAAQAQRDAAIRNMRHSEQFSKKKDEEPVATSQELTSDSEAGVQTRPYPVPQKTASEKDSTSETKKSQVPNPPPGQGASY